MNNAKRLVASVAAVLAFAGVAKASEFDRNTNGAPRAILVRVNSAGEATVFRTDKYDSVTEDNFETAVVETAVEANAIEGAGVRTVKLSAGQSELDFATSTSAWYWWSYGSYWWSVGSWFSYSSYRYSWAYPCWYRGYSYYWYYGAW